MAQGNARQVAAESAVGSLGEAQLASERMTVVDLERELGRDRHQRIEAEVEGTRPVLIALSVQRISGR